MEVGGEAKAAVEAHASGTAAADHRQKQRFGFARVCMRSLFVSKGPAKCVDAGQQDRLFSFSATGKCDEKHRCCLAARKPVKDRNPSIEGMLAHGHGESHQYFAVQSWAFSLLRRICYCWAAAAFCCLSHA